MALRLWDRLDNTDELPEFANVSEELQVFAETLSQPSVSYTHLDVYKRQGFDRKARDSC